MKWRERCSKIHSEVYLFISSFFLVSVMAEAKGPTHLLEVCNQKFSEFLFNAEHKRLVWLREIEEEALKMLNR